MDYKQEEKLFKAYGVLWKPYTNQRGYSRILETPHCANDTCHTLLTHRVDGWFCVKCDKLFVCTMDSSTHANVELMWEGFKTLQWDVHSLEPPPTQIKASDEDKNYWVQVKILEKAGRRFAVMYFGQKIRGEQSKTDYAQVFIDIEDEQLRFDRTNKNPMGILCRMTAEFQDSIIDQSKKEF